MTRLRMALDAIAAAITAPFTTRARRRATNERNHVLLAEKVVAGQRTNGDKP